MADTHLPIVDIPVAFNIDPFDPAPPTPQWTNLAQWVTAIGSAQRGRQYELDQNQTGNMSFDVHDPNETFNPQNTGSAVSPNVQPYRKVLAYATWPNPPGNLFNLTYNATDGGFESYTNGTALATLWPGSANFNCTASATVTTVNPRTGLNCATFAFNAGVNPSWLFVIPTIPGVQYTASAWVRQTAANPMWLFINGGVAGATSTTINAYVRLSVTFTATATTHQLVVGVNGASVGVTTMNVDDIQLDRGAAALTNTTTGGLQRSFWTAGYVERWPSQWEDQGFRGKHTLPCVGPFFTLANQNLNTELRNSILAKSPNYYWPLTESGTTVDSWGDISGNQGPPLKRVDGKYGAGTLDSGADIAVAGDPGSGGVHILNGAGGTRLMSILSIGQDGIKLPGPVGGSYELTLAFVMKRPSAAQLDAQYLVLRNDDSSWSITFGGDSPNGTLSWFSSGHGHFGDNWGDNKPHLFILTFSSVAGTVTLNAYVDNTQPLAGTGFFFSTAVDLSKMWLEVAGENVKGNPGTGFNQELTIADLQYWSRVITGPERADLYNAFIGYYGAGAFENTGQRLTRWLTQYGLSSFATDIQTGNSLCGVSQASAGQTILDAAQGLAKMEFGNFYESATGIAFRQRSDRYLKTVPTIVLGERADLGEYPYQGDITFDFDPTYVYNDADITVIGGQTAHAEDAASQRRYGRKTFGPETFNYANDNDATDAVNYVVGYYKIARPRVEQVTLDLATGRITGSDGTMWPLGLQLEVGQLVRVMRRAKAANSGAGITMQQDYFIENVNHNGIDFETGTWFVTLQLSPALTLRPWILEDPTYGLLESTTYLAF
jgi:hypothetical protein